MTGSRPSCNIIIFSPVNRVRTSYIVKCRCKYLLPCSISAPTYVVKIKCKTVEYKRLNRILTKRNTLIVFVCLQKLRVYIRFQLY